MNLLLKFIPYPIRKTLYTTNLHKCMHWLNPQPKYMPNQLDLRIQKQKKTNFNDLYKKIRRLASIKTKPNKQKPTIDIYLIH